MVFLEECVQPRFSIGLVTGDKSATAQVFDGTLPRITEQPRVVRNCRVECWPGEPLDKAMVEAVRQAQQWLDEHYPDWRNPMAYAPTAEQRR